MPQNAQQHSHPPQVRCILGQVRPDRQTLLFSATMPRKVENLVTDALTGPVRITVGDVGVANEDIKQIVQVLANEPAKLAWLLRGMETYIDAGDVLIFANQKAKVAELTKALQAAGVRAVALHGDMGQASRMQVLKGYREGVHHVLVATDVAARGLDIKSVKTVINYDAAKDNDTHVHRVGRTGRAGDKEGVAYTLLTTAQGGAAGGLHVGMKGEVFALGCMVEGVVCPVLWVAW